MSPGGYSSAPAPVEQPGMRGLWSTLLSMRIQSLRKRGIHAVRRKMANQVLPSLPEIPAVGLAQHETNDPLREIEPVIRNMTHRARLRADALDTGWPYDDRAKMTERLHGLDLQAGAGDRRIDDDTRLRIGGADVVDAAKKAYPRRRRLGGVTHGAHHAQLGIGYVASHEGPCEPK